MHGKQPIRRRPQSPQLRAALRFSKRQLGSIEHERRVLRIAAKLFDLTRPLHGLERQHRGVLRLAAVLHDVGRRHGNKNHPSDGARMISDARELPLPDRRRRAVVYLTRYHRGAVPKTGYDGILRNGDGRRAMRTVLALLRTADALDNRNLPAPAISMTLTGRTLTITCILTTDCPRSRKVFRRRKKIRLLEEMLDCRVALKVRSADAVTSA
jgi:exopolyphosphatase/guanosine-5'-triphosphate,3'-diphosphate pyrophosphatase